VRSQCVDGIGQCGQGMFHGFLVWFIVKKQLCWRIVGTNSGVHATAADQPAHWPRISRP